MLPPSSASKNPCASAILVLRSSSLPGSFMLDSGKRFGVRIRMPQRLCLWSSDFGAPWEFVSEDGVEDGEELSGDGDEGDHFGFSFGHFSVAEDFQDRVVTGGGQSGEEERGSHRRSSAPDHGLALPLAGLAGERGKAG